MCMMPVYYTIIIFDIEEVGLRREKKDQAYRNRYHLARYQPRYQLFGKELIFAWSPTIIKQWLRCHTDRAVNYCLSRRDDVLAFIRGQVEYKDEEAVVLENGGVGYRMRVPQHILQESRVGEEKKLHTYMYVREDEISLYGFASRRELETFKTLISISGIGPKAALALLSTLTVEDLYYAVFSEDVKSITRTPGIGPKGAKRLIMELKDKLDMEEIASDDFGSKGRGSEGSEEEGSSSDNGSSLNDAASALIALGYSGTEAWKAVRAVPNGEVMDVEQLLKESLKHML